MPHQGYLVDANLLTLLVAGRVNRTLIAKHRRLSGYTTEHYDVLVSLLSGAQAVYVTPNVLTEASNLLGQHLEPERSQLFETLRDLIQVSEEIVVASAVASRNSEFTRLGLADAALLELATRERPLLTVDLDLYLAALDKGAEAVNFTDCLER